MGAAATEGGRRVPLYIQILVGVGLGIVTGLVLKQRAAVLGDLGLLVIRLLKALATPLLLFAVLDAFLRTRIPGKQGARLVGISLVNATVAIAIGLGVANVLRTGESFRGRISALLQHTPRAAAAGASGHGAPAAPGATLDPIANLRGYIPESLVEPFLRNNVITVVLLAVLVGAALRKLKDKNLPEHAAGMAAVEGVIAVAFAAMARVLEWVVQLVPIAVFGIVAQLVGRTGLGVFSMLGAFLGTILFGLALHAVVYYSILLRVVGRTSPLRFFRGALDAIVTALSAGSSLATLPVTLRCLREKLGVSESSARLAACVGTNLNHDGIILYEAAAALFMAQAFGQGLGTSQQISVALASLMAGIGIAGVPEAGLITLPLVLSAAGLPDHVTALAVPLILPVDWVLGRGRAATNVISDMTVATLLDRWAANDAPVSASTAVAPVEPAVATASTRRSRADVRAGLRARPDSNG